MLSGKVLERTTTGYWTRLTARLLLTLAAIGLLISPLVLLQADKNYQLRHDALFTEKRMYAAVKRRVAAQYDRFAAIYHTAQTAKTKKVLFSRAPLPWKTCGHDHSYAYGQCMSKPAQQIATVMDGPAQTAKPVTHAVNNDEDEILPVVSSPIAMQQIQAPAQSSVLAAVRPLAGFDTSSICTKGTTDIVVAHQDDDLLFMNPDLSNEIADGRCIRTVYVTAGDAGQGTTYWMNRELGAKAAYATAYKLPDIWQDTTELIAGKSITVSQLHGAPTVALVFLRLPDGNLHGHGFPRTDAQSLQGLLGGSLTDMQSVDGTNTFSKEDLVTTLNTIFTADAPDEIKTLGLAATADGDHSDHLAVSAFTKLAAAHYAQPYTLTTYGGYPEKLLVPNIDPAETALKQEIFFAYAKYDPAVCQSAADCAQTETYSNYLTRQYKADVPATAP